MAKVGRNDPCPCGSGKKYKKCCMSKDTAIDLDSFRAERTEEALRGEILKFATGGRFKDEIVEAFTKYHGDAIDPSMMFNQDPMENIRFLDWFINDHVHSEENKPIIELFSDARAKNLDDDQKALLEEWKESRLGAYEVESNKKGVLKLKDVFGEDTHKIQDESASQEVEAGMVIVARLTSSQGKKKLGGAPVLVPADSKQGFIDSINTEFDKHKEDNPDTELQKFVTENTHLLISAASELAS